MNIIELMNLIISTFTKGAGCTVTAQKVLSEKDMNKGRGANRNPYLGGRVIRVRTYSGYVMGTDYSASVAATAARLGREVSVEEVKAMLKPNWHKPFNFGTEGEWFSTDRSSESKVYLKLGRNQQNIGHKIDTQYYLDGHLASECEVADIEKWLKGGSKTQSSTQTDNGIDKEHEVMFLLPQLDTITYIRQGDKVVHPQEVLAASYALVGA